MKQPDVGVDGIDVAQRPLQQQQSEFVRAFGAWAQAGQDALIDPAALLFMKKKVGSQGVEDFTDTKVACATVETDSHDDAVRSVSEHPHRGLLRGNSMASSCGRWIGVTAPLVSAMATTPTSSEGMGQFAGPAR